MSYRLTGRKSGTVTFLPSTGTILRETITRSSKMTSNAIENGGSIEDHVSLNPEQLQLEGVVVRDHNAFQAKLESMQRNRDLVSYTGKLRVTDYVITNLQIKEEPSNRKGFRFTATLQKANLVAGQYVEIGQTELMSQQDVQNNKTSEEGVRSSQTSSVKETGLKTTVSQQISQSAYTAYVDSYNGKSSSGPLQRKTQSYDGLSERRKA